MNHPVCILTDCKLVCWRIIRTPTDCQKRPQNSSITEVQIFFVNNKCVCITSENQIVAVFYNKQLQTT